MPRGRRTPGTEGPAVATVRAEAEVTLARAIDTVLERHGLLEALTHAPTGFQPLLLAA